jgi:hypothetical protein
MIKVRAIVGPLIMLGLIIIIVLNIINIRNIREKVVEGNNNEVEEGKVYVEVVLWTDNRMIDFIMKDWTDFVKEYTKLPQTIIIRKDCKEMLDFLNTIPTMKAAIDLRKANDPQGLEKDLKALCPCVMLLFHDKSHNTIKREIRGLLSSANSNLNKNSLISSFELVYNTPYKGKTVSTK